MNSKFDFFLSHAGSDKEVLAKPLAKELSRLGHKVWLDENEIPMGASIVRSISDGLNESEHVILIISRAYLDREWPKKELDAIFSLENQPGSRIIPLRFGISNEEIFKTYSLLADRNIQEIKTDGLSSLAKQISANHAKNTRGLKKRKPKMVFLCGTSSSGKDSTLSQLSNKYFLDKAVNYFSKVTTRTLRNDEMIDGEITLRQLPYEVISVSRNEIFTDRYIAQFHKYDNIYALDQKEIQEFINGYGGDLGIGIYSHSRGLEALKLRLTEIINTQNLQVDLKFILLDVPKENARRRINGRNLSPTVRLKKYKEIDHDFAALSNLREKDFFDAEFNYSDEISFNSALKSIQNFLDQIL